MIFADRFPGGVPDAITACPANGCIIYALSPSVNLNLSNIDPGTKSVTIYLGPYTFTVKTITLRKGMKIIGMGASQSASGTAVCTVDRALQRHVSTVDQWQQSHVCDSSNQQ